jgi:murein DD-endopeptidase MepM/ murein hydrolase activator NlpD
VLETELAAKCWQPAHETSRLPLAAPAGDCYLRTVSSPRAAGPRHAGKVVDPLVREDGQPDPEVYLAGTEEPDVSPSSPAEHPVISEENPDQVEVDPAVGEDSSAPEGLHPVRARLLAKAAALAAPAPPPAGLAELDPDPPPPGRPLDLELDLVAAPSSRAPSAPLVGRRRGHLSPNMIWLVGTLLGLVTVASIIAVAIRLDPHRGLSGIRPASSAAEPTASVGPAPAPSVPPRVRVKLPGPWRIQDADKDGTARIVTGEIGRQAFLRAIEDAGVPKKECYRVLTALKGLVDLDKCDRRDRFTALVRRADARVTAFEYLVSKEEVYQAREGGDGLLRATKLDLKVARGQVKGVFVMDGEWARSVERAGFDPSLSRVMALALNGHMSVSEIERGDMVRLIVQEVTVLGDFSRYSGLEALEYRPADGKKKSLRVYYFRGPKSHGYFDGAGRSPYEGGWRKPIPGAPITSPFNLKRMHPVLRKIMPHLGIDFGAPAGTPVGASSYGTVSFAGYSGPAGNLVKIHHPDGVETGYGHLQRFAEGLAVGDQVKRLEVLGYVGSTGRSTGPHLHFMAKKDGKYFDPMDLKLDAMRVLPEDERPPFNDTKATYDRHLDAIAWPPPLPTEPAASPSASVAASETDGEPIGMEEAAASAQPSATSPGGAPAAPATSARKAGHAVYLTDKELLESQPMSDDGESAE